MVATRLRFEEVFKNRAVVMVGVQADDVYAPSTLAKVARVTEGLRAVPSVIPGRVVSLATVQDVTTHGDALDVHTLMGEVPRTPSDVSALRAAVEANEIVSGRLVSRDGKLTAILAFLQDDYDREQVYRSVSALIAPLQGPERIFAAGDAIFTTQIEQGTQIDSQRLVPLALLAIVLGLYVCFRRALGVLLPFVAVGLSIAWAMGSMGLLGLPQTVISTALPVLIMVVAGSYGIHIMLHYYDAPEGLSPAEAAACTPCAGPCRACSGGGDHGGDGGGDAPRVPGALDPGVFHRADDRPRARGRHRLHRDAGASLSRAAPQGSPLVGCSSARWLRKATLAAVDHRRAVLLVYAALVVAAAVGVTRIKTGNDFQAIFPAEHVGRRTFESFNTHLGGVRSMNVMIDGGRLDAIKSPQYLRAIADIERFLQAQPGVGSSMSIADVVRQVHHTFAPDTGDLPRTQAEVAQELLLFEMGSDASDVADLVDTAYQRTNVTVMIATSDPDAHKRIYDAARDYLGATLPSGGHAEFGGEVLFWLAQVDYVIIGKILNVAATIVIIFLFVALVYRSWSAGLLCMASVLFGTLLTFGLMGASHIRLDFATAIITSIAVGIGVDFSIQYLNELTKASRTARSFEDALELTASTSGRQVLFTAGSNMVGFLVVVLSGFLPVRHFGLLVSVAMFSMGVSTLFLLPVLAAATRPRFLRPVLRAGASPFWERGAGAEEPVLAAVETASVSRG